MKPLRNCFYILLSLSLSGCARYDTTLLHPETGDIQKCDAKGSGIIPAQIAETQYNACINQLKKLGYEPVSGS